MNKNFMAACLHSVSQVFFIENKYTALFFLCAIAHTSYLLNSPHLFISAVMGAVFSNIVAIQLKYNQDDIQAGLYGFNGVLIALAVCFFIQTNPFMWVIMLIAIYLSVIVSHSFYHLLTKKFNIPYSTGPFVFCAWFILFAAYQFSSVTVNTGIHPHFVSNFSQQTSLLSVPVDAYINAVFKNIGQVLFLPDPMSGLLILIGIFIGGYQLGLFALFGSIIAIATGFVFQVDTHLMFNGLYGFSPVLTALAFGCVFIQNQPIYALFAVIITVFLQAALYSLTASFAVPTFTSAYVLCLYLFIAAKNNKEEC